MMSVDNENLENGRVEISDDIVTSMAAIAASSIKGVYIAKSRVMVGITSIFSRNDYSSGIKVDINENTVVLDININVEYGSNLNEIARQVQTAVKNEIETMTELSVSAVNVRVVNFTENKQRDKENTDENSDADNTNTVAD
jgi:uncharacterized alkaline shock family protein YloU